MSDEQKPAFDGWAVVEQMGHNQYAGKVSEFQLGGASLIRIEVPEIPERKRMRTTHDYRTGECINQEETVPGRQAFTKFIGPASVFAITPCTEEVARKAAEGMRADPITCVAMPETRALIASAESEDDEEDNRDVEF